MENKAGELSEESFAFKEVTWQIPNFLELSKKVFYDVTSPEFRLANATWHLRLTILPSVCGNEVFIKLARSESSVPEHCIHHTIGLKTRLGMECFPFSTNINFDRNYLLGQLLIVYNCSNIMAQEHCLLSNGTMTVFCRIRVKEEATPEASSCPQQRRKEPSQTELQEASSRTEVPESGNQIQLQEVSCQTEMLELGTQTEFQKTSSVTEVPESAIQADVKEAITGVQKLQLDYKKLPKSEKDSNVFLKASEKEFRDRSVLRNPDFSSTRMTNKTGELSEEYFKEVLWQIPNFMDQSKTVGYNVTSPEFRLANATWYLRLKPSFFGSGFVMYLVRSESSVPEHCIHRTAGLKTRCGVEHNPLSTESTFDMNFRRENFLVTYQYCNITDKEHYLLPNGTMTLFCRIRVKEEATPEASSRPQHCRNEQSQTEQQETSSQTEVPVSGNQMQLQKVSSQTETPASGARTELQEASSLTEVPKSATQADVKETITGVQKLQLDYAKLLKSEEDSDVCLKVSDKEFRAHSCILRARSKVFYAMFKHETEEKASGEVVIDDLDPDSFPDFLQYLYAGRVETLTSKNVSSLYSAADKYDLQELKSECRDYMKRTLSVDTFCDVMTLALMHQEEELLKLAIEFFSKNYTKIFVTVKWQTFLKDHHVAANELLIKAFVPGDKNESS